MQWVIDKIGKIKNGISILDVGAGECKYKRYCTHLIYQSQDFCKYFPDKCGDVQKEKEWKYNEIDIVSDISNIPVPDNSFGAILCTDVLEHLPDPIAAIKEFTRILNVGGTLILSTPFACNAHQSPYFFNCGLSTEWYKKYLCDYEIVEIHYSDSWYIKIKNELERIKAISYSEHKLSDSEINSVNDVIGIVNALDKKQSGSEIFNCGSIQVFAVKK